MSKLARTLILGAALAAMNLAGMTAVAQAQPNDPDGKQARRQATEGQVGETWRKHQTHTTAGRHRRCGRAVPSRRARITGADHP